MSLLPQRKKSAEEIAKLRETFGIPGAAAASEDVSPASPAPEGIIESPVEKAEAPVPAETTLPAMAVAPPPKPVKSLRRSERSPVLPAADAIQPAILSTPHSAKPVRSLRKTEQVPLAATDHHTPPADSTLPFHRHSDEEMDKIRLQAAISRQAAPVLFADQIAHFALLIPAYLLAIGGGVCFHFYEFPIGATAGCAGAALLIAIYIFLKKPLSRHHAAFLSVIVMFVIVFGALYYFPQLRHGS